MHDDATVAEAAGLAIALVSGDERLRKVTFASDFEDRPMMCRTGSGFDVHRLTDGEDLWLCGVKIDHPQGLAGHSDADVALHALPAALLGTIAAGDIRGSIHQVGATLQNAPSCNGWTFWHLERQGALVPLDTVRTEMLAAAAG